VEAGLLTETANLLTFWSTEGGTSTLTLRQQRPLKMKIRPCIAIVHRPQIVLLHWHWFGSPPPAAFMIFLIGRNAAADHAN